MYVSGLLATSSGLRSNLLLIRRFEVRLIGIVEESMIVCLILVHASSTADKAPAPRCVGKTIRPSRPFRHSIWI